jgi:flagellar protein FliS
MKEASNQAQSTKALSVQLTGVSPGELLIIMFDGMLKSLSDAKESSGDARKDNLKEAISIIQDALRPGLGKITDETERELDALYEYCARQLESGKGDDITEVIELLTPIRDVLRRSMNSNSAHKGQAKKKALGAYTTSALDAEVAGASPAKIILMLFDGAINSIQQAKVAISHSKHVESSKSIIKAYNIVQLGLRDSLRHDVDAKISGNLDALYDYCGRKLMEASRSKKVALLDEVAGLLKPVADAWRQKLPEMEGMSGAATGGKA